MGSLNSTQAMKAVVGGTRYSRLVTDVAAPRWINRYSSELPPSVNASTDQASAPSSGALKCTASVSSNKASGAIKANAARFCTKLAVGTAGDIHNVHFALSHLQMDVQPLAIVRGDEGLPGKPEPAIFLEAARRIDVPPQHCIVFEDAPFGIEAARRAGMRAVAVCSTHSPAQLAGPHVLAAVRDYTELMNTDFLESIHVATV